MRGGLGRPRSGIRKAEAGLASPRESPSHYYQHISRAKRDAPRGNFLREVREVRHDQMREVGLGWR